MLLIAASILAARKLASIRWWEASSCHNSGAGAGGLPVNPPKTESISVKSGKTGMDPACKEDYSRFACWQQVIGEVCP